MRHGRSDYNRIQDPANMIPEHEPVFLIRGQDEAAVEAVQWYANFADKYGGHDVAARAREWAKEIERWQVEHGRNSPDMPEDA